METAAAVEGIGLLNAINDINYILASVFGFVILGIIKWVMMRLDKEKDSRHLEAQTDRHDLRQELQGIKNELTLARQLITFNERLLEEMREQMHLKDQELVKLRDLVAQYTKILIQRGVEDERRLKGRVDASGESLAENIHLHGTIESLS